MGKLIIYSRSIAFISWSCDSICQKMAIIMEGPLSKWTNVMKGWQYRWFVLDENAGLLSYYTVSNNSMITYHEIWHMGHETDVLTYRDFGYTWNCSFAAVPVTNGLSLPWICHFIHKLNHFTIIWHVLKWNVQSETCLKETVLNVVRAVLESGNGWIHAFVGCQYFRYPSDIASVTKGCTLAATRSHKRPSFWSHECSFGSHSRSCQCHYYKLQSILADTVRHV